MDYEISYDGQSHKITKNELLEDYRIACLSRQVSIIGRKEVLNGKAKFGIFGDGKELAQIAMAKAFNKGDWRSGYYRDQTFMFATGCSNPTEYFAQLYANPSIEKEPASGGRQMNSHFATRFLTEDEKWLNQVESYNSSSDISPTGGQMARLLGLGYASLLYRNTPELKKNKNTKQFSNSGNEVAFGTIGNASTSEGLFWETLNACGVLKLPIVFSVWDDGYGISVPSEYQTTKSCISTILSGFNPEEGSQGITVFKVDGHDFPALVETYFKAASLARTNHQPCLIHVANMTQPQGHSTSGSHERYKSKERLKFEQDFDCISKFKEWLISNKLSNSSELASIEKECEALAQNCQKQAWQDFQEPIEAQRGEIENYVAQNAAEFKSSLELPTQGPFLRSQNQAALEKLILKNQRDPDFPIEAISKKLSELKGENKKLFNSKLYSSKRSPLTTDQISPIFEGSNKVDGRQIIQRFFDITLQKDPRVFIIGEDVGQLGGVNLEFEGLQEKHGKLRVTDTGIREATILGQGIGCALRGLRPIVDIQYLDYLIYCIQGISDDLATVRYRTAGGQCAPLIVRTKGHRLEGIWHTGSPMGMILGASQGVHVCVPRNSTQAAGMYQTLLQGEDPAIVIEVLNGYRLKEDCPTNIGEYTVPLGVPEVLKEGSDITIVTYGANVRVAMQACQTLQELGVSCELIDAQTLLPFDRFHLIKKSIMKTNALLCLDEDAPGCGTGFMLQKILEEQSAYDFLDAKPRSISAHPHRSSYATDGDYYSKPNSFDIISTVQDMMFERAPHFS